MRVFNLAFLIFAISAAILKPSPFHTACRTSLKLQEPAQAPFAKIPHQPAPALAGVASLRFAWCDL